MCSEIRNSSEKTMKTKRNTTKLFAEFKATRALVFCAYNVCISCASPAMCIALFIVRTLVNAQ
jgi:hypothetical protein